MIGSLTERRTTLAHRYSLFNILPRYPSVLLALAALMLPRDGGTKVVLGTYDS